MGDIRKLQSPMTLRIKGRDFITRPCKATLLDPQPQYPDRTPPIRVRLSVPDKWISLTLVEGKNRQVRRMTAALGFPTLRLIREAIGPFKLRGLKGGEVREVTEEEINKLIHL
jgi:23S rRNA pseudouridine2457 synthase